MPNCWENAEGMATREVARRAAGCESLPVTWSRSGTAEDAELLHAGLEVRSLEAQDLGGAALTADPPMGLLENCGDVLTLDILEAAQLLLWAPAGRRHDVPQLEAALGREDDCPLDDVLQLAHI